MPQKNVVVIGANEYQLPLVLKARSRGYRTHVFAWEEGAVARPYADEFYPISITETGQILAKCRGIAPDAVVTAGSDLAVKTVNEVAAALGLPGNPPDTTLCCTNKYAMRRALARAGLPVPGFALADGDKAPQGLRFPLIVKPTDRSGSRGVCRVDDPAQLPGAVRAAVAASFEKKAIVEEYFEGIEFSCEGISQDGSHHFLAFTRKFTTGAPHFIETGHLQPSGLSEQAQRAVKAVLARALDVLGIRSGASHSEFRLSPDGRLCIMEIGARMGGDFIGTHLVPLSTGHDYTGYLLDTALGLPLELKPGQTGGAAVRFVFNQQELDLLKTLRRKHPEALRAAQVNSVPQQSDVQDSAGRYGYFVAAAPTARQAAALCGLAGEELDLVVKEGNA